MVRNKLSSVIALLFLAMCVTSCSRLGDAEINAEDYRKNPGNERSLKRLLRDARSWRFWIRHEAIVQLRLLATGNVGRAREEAVPVLAAALNDKDQGIRREAAFAFMDLSPTEVGQGLEPLLNLVRTQVEEDVVWCATEALGGASEVNDQALEKVIEALVEAGEVSSSRTIAFGAPNIRESCMKAFDRLLKAQRIRVSPIIERVLLRKYGTTFSPFAVELRSKL